MLEINEKLNTRTNKGNTSKLEGKKMTPHPLRIYLFIHVVYVFFFYYSTEVFFSY